MTVKCTSTKGTDKDVTPEVSVIEYLIYYTQSALIHTEKILLFATFMLLESLLKKLREYSTRIIALSKLRFFILHVFSDMAYKNNDLQL